MWKYIEEINWSELSKTSRGYEAGKKYMLENFTPKRCKEISDFICVQHKALYKRINEYERANDTHCGTYGGDDSFSDMIEHVIGCGEEKYNLIMEIPAALNDMEFVESFAYCMPDDEDFKMMHSDYHLERAKEAVVELARIVAENKPSGDDVRTIKEIMERFLTMLSGDFDGAVYDFDRQTYNRFYEFDSNDQCAMFSNYISDCKKSISFIS